MNEIHILLHSLGLDQHGLGSMYRNHFCTGEGSVDYSACMSLVEKGLMTRREGSPVTGGNDLFIVTEAGKTFVVDNSPAPPKLTRGQQRYQEYLAFDSGLSFIEFCRMSDRVEKEGIPF